MPPKKNQQKMSLNDFLADESTGKTSWADEMDELPTAPMPRESSYRRGGDFLSSVPDRAERDRMGPASFERPERSYPPRVELPLPDKPPFTAFIGNLSYDVTESEIADFFAPSNTVSVRLISQDGKPKGFGYVEFETLDGLKAALDKNQSQLANRTVRVSVAEAPKSGADRGGFSSVADETSQWRRAGPLPPAPDAPPRGAYGARSERSGFGRSETGPSGFDNMDVSSGARSGFGSKFQPSAPPRAPREPVEPSQGDVVSDWRTGKPVEGPPSRRPSGMGPQGEPRAPSFKKSDATDVDERFASQERMGFGSKFSPAATPPESPSNTKRGFGFGAGERRGSGPQGASAATASDSVDTWRSARKPTGNSPAPAAGAPVERKKLELKKRSSDAAAASAGPSSSSKPSPFGNAKPVDAAEREKQIEEKLAQKEKERQEEIKAKKEKARAEKEKADKSRTSTADGAKAVEEEGQENKADSPAAAETKTEAASKPRSTPPTGAWGGGRKPAGALAAEQAAKQAAEEARKAAANGAADSEVKQVTAELEKANVDA